MEIKASVEPLSSEHSTIQAVIFGGTGEVGKPTKTILNLKASVPLPKDTIITIDFPKYNTEAPSSEQTSYFQDPDNPICSPKTNAAAETTCSIEQDLEDFDDNLFDRFTITGSLPNGLGRG